jgi:hypothetical protein
MDLFADKKTKQVFQIYQGDHRNFHLSGVGLFSLWNNGFLRVPRNENELILGKPWKIPDKFIEAYMGTIEYDFKDYNPCGYPIHERCWVLMTRILDVNLIKAHLNLFVKAICEMNKKPKIYDLAWKTCEENEMVQSEGILRREVYTKPRQVSCPSREEDGMFREDLCT